MEILLYATIVVGFYMAWNIGANDVANSMGSAVGAKAIKVMPAMALAGICEFAGAVLVGSTVTDTIRKGIVEPQLFAALPNGAWMLGLGLFCALVSAGLWLNIATYFGMPVSTTHSIVGAICGFGIITVGVVNIRWGVIGQIVSSWFISPLAGAAIAFLNFKLISIFMLAKENPLAAAINGAPACAFVTFFTVTFSTVYKGLAHLGLDLDGMQAAEVSCAVGFIASLITWAVVRAMWKRNSDGGAAEQLKSLEQVFTVLVIISSCSLAFAHGANDVANAIGPLAAVVDIVRTGDVEPRVHVALWVLVLGGIGIVVGLMTFGYRVMQTVGTKITHLTPSRGVAADIGAMITVLTASKLGLPISTTHTLVGAIIGVGLARGITSVDSGTIRNIFVSWLATLPFVIILTIILFIIARPILL